jgi:23S rRNA pseudouridine1911/1915/1917 synthase
MPKTGRKHQIRIHFCYLGHPIVGDKLYAFKNQILPNGLKRHFLHASYLKIRLPDGREMEFKSGLPEDLEKVLESLNK